LIDRPIERQACIAQYWPGNTKSTKYGGQSRQTRATNVRNVI